MKRSPFPIRLLWATTPQQREMARKVGCNWALVYTCGHRRNDFPIDYAADPKVAALRRRESGAVVKAEKRSLRRGVDHAHALGMKAMVHSYELSIPEEFRTIYPRLYRPEVKEYRAASPDVRRNRAPCAADPRVREILAEKVAETVAAAPEMDAYAFSLNECLSRTTIRHRCELCRDVPFPQMIKWVADSVRDGIRSVSSRVQFLHRLWGLNEHDDMYYRNYGRQLDFTEGSGKPWLKGFVDAFRPAAMHYVPSRDLPRYLAMQAQEQMGFIAKASWADVSIDHPLNPWIPHLHGHDTIVELSWEQTNQNEHSFHVLAQQFQRMARYAHASGANGLAGIPCNWGYKPEHQGPARGRLEESYHKLGLLNFDVFRAVVRDPEVDLARVLDSALKRRYGRRLPRRLTEMLIESQSIKAGSVNIRGIRSNGNTLERAFYQLMRYAPTFKDWRTRLSRSPRNVTRVLREADRNMRRASAAVEEIKGMEGRIPDKAFHDFMASFTSLERLSADGCRRQKRHFLLWAMKDGTIPCSMATIEELERTLPA